MDDEQERTNRRELNEAREEARAQGFAHGQAVTKQAIINKTVIAAIVVVVATSIWGVFFQPKTIVAKSSSTCVTEGSGYPYTCYSVTYRTFLWNMQTLGVSKDEYDSVRVGQPKPADW